MDLIEIDGKQFEGYNIATIKSNLLMIKASKGFLGCGYFDIATANRLGEAVAIVTGVKNYDDMLSAKVIKVSEEAKKLGLQQEITGKDALNLLN